MDVSTAGNGRSGVQRLSVSRQLVMDTVERRICSYQWTTETVEMRSVDEHFGRIELVECDEYSWSAVSLNSWGAISSTVLSRLVLHR